MMLGTNAAFADMCPKCQGGMGTCDIGKCQSCGGMTSSGSHKLCRNCSKKQKKCQRCLASLEKKKSEPKKAVKLLPDGKTFKFENKNDKLMDLAPVKEPGYSVITSKKVFAKLWNAWYDGKKKVPHVDFQKQFVIAAVASMGNGAVVECKTVKGNLTVNVARTEMAGTGFGFTFVIKNRKGIKTLDGKPLPECSDFVKVGTTWSKRANIQPVRCENRAGQVSLITTRIEFTRQWSSWFPNQAQPDVNFEKDFVMYAIGYGGNIPSFGIENKDGNLRVMVRTTRMMRPGFGVRMTVFSREKIKTVNKVKLPEGSMKSLPNFVGNVKIDKSSNGKTIKLALNQQLEVVLDGNPSTGFAWKNVTKDKGACMNGPMGFSSQAMRGGRRPICGAPGKFIAKYYFEKEGTYTVKLEYVRPFGNNQKPAETFTVKVKVTKAINAKQQPKNITLLVCVKDTNKIKQLADQVAFAKKVDKIATLYKCKIKIDKVLTAVGVMIVKVTATDDQLKKVEAALKQLDNVKYVERDGAVGIQPVPNGGNRRPPVLRPMPRPMPVRPRI